MFFSSGFFFLSFLSELPSFLFFFDYSAFVKYASALSRRLVIVIVVRLKKKKENKKIGAVFLLSMAVRVQYRPTSTKARLLFVDGDNSVTTD